MGAKKIACADSLIGGRYRLGTRVAAGGMGEVWRAYDEVLGRLVAVKVLRSEYVDDATFCERFRTEARNTAALSHPGIVHVYDFGETKIGSRSSSMTVPYIAMELVPGEPLSAIIAREGAMPVDRATSIIGQAAAALHAAHELGVVHRDVKPANLMLTPTGTVKVTDFGIARATHAASLTRLDTVVGTAQYLAPELTGSRSPATPLSDLYALGLVFYECLSGRHPFRADNAVAVALAHQHEQPAPLPDHVPAAIGNFVLRMLAKDPAQRPASAAEVARQLTVPAESASKEGHPTMMAASAGVPSDLAASGGVPSDLAASGGVLSDLVATDQLDIRSVRHDTTVLDPADAEPAALLRPRRAPPRFGWPRVAVLLLAFVVLTAVSASLQVAVAFAIWRWADGHQLVDTHRLTVALETFRPSNRAEMSKQVDTAELAPDRSVRSDPGWCTPLSLLAVKGAIGGASWTGVNGKPPQPVTTLTVRYPDAALARRELLDKRIALVACRTVHLTFSPFDTPAEDFRVTGRVWAAFSPADRLRYSLVGHGNRYEFYVRRYANTLTWTYGDDHSEDRVRREVVDDLIKRLKELAH